MYTWSWSCFPLWGEVRQLLARFVKTNVEISIRTQSFLETYGDGEMGVYYTHTYIQYDGHTTWGLVAV